MTEKEKAPVVCEAAEATEKKTPNLITDGLPKSIPLEEVRWNIARLMMYVSMLMPEWWIRENGKDSDIMRSLEIAVDLIKEKERQEAGLGKVR